MNDQVFRLPDLGEGLTEADILQWCVAVGDTVSIDQIVAEVETAKAAVEVPVPFEGTVVELHGNVGDTLEVGSPLITVRGVDSAGEPETGTSVAHERYREEERAGSGNVLIGYGTGHATPRRRRRVNQRSSSAPVLLDTKDPAGSAQSRQRPDSPSALREIAASPPKVISPLVRAIGLRKGLDLSAINGSGPGGVIIRADVERAQPSTVRMSSDTYEAQAERLPLKGLRKAVADKLSVSRREIPDATTWVDVDASELLEARHVVNAALPNDLQVSLLALLSRLALVALASYPELNASIDTERSEIIRHPHVNLGVAVQASRGLLVPVVEAANLLNTVELAQQLRATVAAAREGKLPPSRLRGGTFTLNNYGVFGVDGSTPIINHPEAAILGVGRIIDRPWVVDGRVATRKLTQISLTFDHRICDGGVAGGFLRLFGDYIENPVAVLGRL
ncbi:dihydrolipoamide acetyltransferase family protein [Nocardia sp. CY41]|uniref:dihydrolipoamide acetyltransferase family protein n=1 Tax=Nocardia sp. CY41 TaxID=2608686 RepID=UPI00135A1FBD|nr:dihydrolipoamide acetyltransferase family protein [Nocardia sp. CY41]